MRPETFLEHYRISSAEGEAPVEIGRNGPAVTYKGSDLKSGAPVAVTLVPIGSVDQAARERFEEDARTAMLLDHVNIARTVAFGTADDFFVFVSEYPQGETVESWVKANGPMPADAVLRIALQVVAALGAASFHGLTHPAIQPSNLVIVRGKTAEGGWPFVKLTHFGLASLKSAPGHADPDLNASDFASPEQLLQGKVDFRSEIYSLGATMCFLLTGVFYSAYPRSPQTKRFARPLRNLIARTLEDDPSQRPQDPVLFTDELRACLGAVERRQALQSRFGIPFSPIVAKAPRQRRILQRRPKSLVATIGPAAAATAAPQAAPVARSSRLMPILAVVGLLLLAGIVGALLLPEDVVTAALHRKKHSVETIGVPVGVPESSPAALVQAKTSSPAPAPTQQNSRPEAAKIATSENSASTPGRSPVRAAESSSRSAAESSAPVDVVQQSSAPPARTADTSDSARPIRGDEQQATAAPAAITSNSSTSAPAPATTGSVDREVTATPAPTPVSVAANNISAEPAPPSEAPDQKPEAQPDQTTGAASADTDVEQAPASSESESRAARAKPRVASETTASKTHRKKSGAVAETRTHSTRGRVPRALPAEPDSEPVHSGTVRARVVGITPAGNVILALPSGEQAIVAPQDAEQYSRPERVRHRPRRVIIERRVYGPQYPPYQPFIPPDA